PGTGRRILHSNPMEYADKPKYQVRARKHRVTPDRYARMDEHANLVDRTGRFRAILAIARWYGVRLETICSLRRQDILFGEREIADALRNCAAPYVAPQDVDDVAREYAKGGGAIYFRRETVKQAKTGVVGVEQYDRVVPMGPIISYRLRH